ncbi:MAG: polyprenol monophosphomannose synthase [Acidobacteria bacterium]|nr:MAG: polyprenol monophosphomannose synthase [Acidobacteriota bacterium]
MTVLVVVPTFNEVSNIGTTVSRVMDQPIDELHMLIVDDDSPDGTAAEVRRLQAQYANLHLIVREGARGLGRAYVRGFKFALKRGFDLIFEMDADGSHNPDDLPRFLEQMDRHDLVIGSRYVEGGGVTQWPYSRLLLSYWANVYVRAVTALPIRDCTSGFKCYRRAVLEAFDLSAISANGYAFQIEVHYLAHRCGFRISEIPIIFTDREEGSSKMNTRIMREAVVMPWRLLGQRAGDRLPISGPGPKECEPS